MRVRKIAIVLLTLVVVSCEGITNEEKAEKLNNEVDQAKVDQLLANVTKDNYADRMSDLSGIYGKRMNTIGFDTGDAEHILNETFTVWPTNVPVARDEATSQLRTRLNKYEAEAKRLKAKGKDMSAFDVMLDSEEADTAFSKIEQQFLQDVQKVFAKKDQKASYYESKLDNLKSEYQSNYDLTDKEYITIVGISKSVGSLLMTIHQLQTQSANLLPLQGNVNKAGIFPSSFLLSQTGGCDSRAARYAYTAPDCSFNPDYGQIGGAGALGMAWGFLGSSISMGYGAAVGSAFGPAGSAAGAAAGFAWHGFWGGASGATIELVDQHMTWQQFTEEIEEDDQ